MIDLQIKDYFPVGYIAKPHGLRGEMVVEVEEGFEDILLDSEYLLLGIEGGLVPFFISEEGINFRTDTSFSVTFDDIVEADLVRSLCGCKIYLHKDAIREEETGDEFNELIGVKVFDGVKGELGEIVRVDDFSGNIVLTIEHGDHEILIPLSEELITKFDELNRELHLECPEGLIDMYLE